MKNKKTLVIGIVAILALALVMCLMVGINHITKERPAGNSGSIDSGENKQTQADGVEAPENEETEPEGNTFTVIVVHADGSEKSFTYTTQKDYLGEVLLSEGLISGEDGPYGLYIHAVDGEQAIYEEDSAYWCLYIGDEMAMTGVSETVIHDGDIFKLVYTGA